MNPTTIRTTFRRAAWLIGLLALTALPLALTTGCGTTLAPGGAYARTNAAPDLALYRLDAAFATAHTAVDVAFQFEADNRALCWRISPQIKHSLDAIRPQATATVRAWAYARRAYLADPVPENLPALQQILAKLEQFSGAVTAALQTVPNP